MHKLALTTLAVASLAGAGVLAFSPLAPAQPAAAPPGAPAVAMPAPAHGVAPGPMAGPMTRPAPTMGPGPWMQGHAAPWMEGRPGPWMGGAEMRRALFARLRTWGPFHRPADLALTPADVKVIGEAILLRNGQHDWKVGDVTPNADNTVSFAFVTVHGDLVARFAINTRTGRIVRTD